MLIVIVATVGGSLKDEFTIPGSESQKATDLIESEFASEQGGVLNLVFAAPKGETLDTPERKQAINAAIAKLKTSEFKPTKDHVGIESVGDPFSADTFSKNRRIAYAEAQFNKAIFAKDRDQVVAVEDAVRNAVESAGVTVEYNGDAEFPPIKQGPQELLGLLAALIVLLVVFRTFVATMIPIFLALTALATAFILLFILAGLTDINTITPLLVSMIGLGVGIDYSLFIVTRFRQLLHEGLSSRRCRRRGRRVGGPRRALRRPDGRDLGHRSRLLRPRLRDQARNRLGARRADERADRELAAARRAAAAGPQGRPVEGALLASHRRHRGGAREDADRPLGPVRHRSCASRVHHHAPGGTRPRDDVRARPPGRGGSGDAAHEPDGAPRLRPARRGLRPRLQRADPDRGRRQLATSRRRRRSTTACRA